MDFEEKKLVCEVALLTFVTISLITGVALFQEHWQKKQIEKSRSQVVESVTNIERERPNFLPLTSIEIQREKERKREL